MRSFCFGTSLVLALTRGPVEDGEAHLKAKRAAEAEAAFSQALALSPADPRALIGRGRARWDLGDRAGAEADFNRAVRVAPENAEAWRRRGLFRLSTNNAAGALEDLDRALELEPQDATALSGRGLAHLGLKDYSAAIVDYTESLRLRPNNALTLAQRGYAWELRGERDIALIDLRQALAVDPKQRLALERLARLEPGAVPPRTAAATPGPAKAGGPPRGALLAVGDAAGEPRVATAGTASTPPPRVPPGTPSTRSGASARTRATATPAAIAAPAAPPPTAIPVVTAAAQAKPAAAVAGTPDLVLKWGPFEEGWRLRQSRRSETPWPDRGEAALTERVVFQGDAGGAFLRAEGGCFLQVVAGPQADNTSRPKSPAELLSQVLGPEGHNDFGYVASEGRMAGHPALFLNGDPGGGSLKFFYLIMPRESRSNLQLSGEVWGDKSNAPRYRQKLEQALRTFRLEAGEPAETGGLELLPDPVSKTALRADGRDGVLLRARASAADPGAARKATQVIRFSATGDGARWVDLSPAETRGDWRCVYVQATNPDPVRGAADPPPAALTILAQTQDGARVLTRSIRLAVAAGAELDAKPDRAEFLRGSGQTAAVDLAVANPGTGEWSFRAEYAKGDRPAAGFRIRRTDASHAVLELTEARLDPLPSAAEEIVTLRVLAEQKGAAPLERHVKVTVGQEGLYVVPIGRAEDGRFHVAADGRREPKEIDFRVMVWDPQAGRLVSSPALAQELEFAPDPDQPAESIHALEVAGLSSTSQIARGGVRGTNDPSGTYRFVATREVPSNAPVVQARLRATDRGPAGREYAVLVPLALRTLTIGPQSPEWKVEYERCQEVINRFVPAKYWPKLNEILEKRKMALGPQGLYAMRRQLWQIAVHLTLAEGGEGWARLEPWESGITSVLEWTELGSKVAFDVLAGVAVGPVYGPGLSKANEIVKSALVAWDQGELPDGFGTWFWNETVGLLHLRMTMLSDSSALMQHLDASPVEAFAICVGYQFAYNLTYEKQSIADAAKNAATFALGRTASRWLTVKILQHPRFLATMKVDVPPNETVLWSGADGALMAGRKGTPLNATEAGKWAQDSLATQGLSWEQAKRIWAEISRRYAEQARGKVTVYLEHGLQPGKVFAETELGALLKNPAVTQVEVYVKEGGKWVAKNWFAPK